MTTRRKDWAPYIRSEIDAVKNIVWFLQNTMLHMGTLHDHITSSQIKRMPILQRDLQARARDIYNLVFRDSSTSKFVVVDTNNEHLDQRIGTILSFDVFTGRFNVDIFPKKKASGKSCHQTSLKPEHMKMLLEVPVDRYNSVPKVETASVSIPHNFVALGSTNEVTIEFVANIFQSLGRKFLYFEQYDEIASNALRTLLDERKVAIQENRHKLLMETANFEKACRNLTSTRLDRNEQPTKRRRVLRAMPTATRAQQIVSVWNAKFDHIHSQTHSDVSHETDERHLCTLPFRTCDGNLMQASKGLSHFDIACDNGIGEADLEREMDGQHIVITKESMDSVGPGRDIDDDVFDFSHKWYVNAIFFSDVKKKYTDLTIQTKDDMQSRTILVVFHFVFTIHLCVNGARLDPNTRRSTSGRIQLRRSVHSILRRRKDNSVCRHWRRTHSSIPKEEFYWQSPLHTGIQPVRGRNLPSPLAERHIKNIRMVKQDVSRSHGRRLFDEPFPQKINACLFPIW
jgi:hypothetical protein